MRWGRRAPNAERSALYALRFRGFARAITAQAIRVNVQRVIVDPEAAGLCHFGLALFDFRIVKLFDVAALHADQVIVVGALIEFEHRFIGFEVVANQQPGLFELHQHAVNRGQPGVRAFFLQQLVDFFG